MIDRHVIAHKLYGEDEQEFDLPDSLRDFASYIYLHGRLQDINGYDICSFVIGNHPNRKGVFPVKVYVDKCTIIYSTMFLWDDRLRKNTQHGLIVMNGDEYYMADAKEKYENKKQYI